MLDIFTGKVDDLEEAVDRFVSTSEEFYDKDLHVYIMEETKSLINEVRESSMKVEEKNVVVELITTVMEFASIDIKKYLN